MKEDNADKETTRIRPSTPAAGKVPGRYQASIVILAGYAEGMEYPITADYTVIGRDKSANIVVKDPLVSRQHAAILYHDGAFRLKDLESTNGTMMNGTMIQMADIHHKDKFRVGDTTIQFILFDTKQGNTYEIR